MKAKVKEDAELLDVVMGLLNTASKSTVKRLIKNRRVAVERKVQTKLDLIVAKGQNVEILPEPEHSQRTRRPLTEAKLPFKILHEDEQIIVVDKPAGMLSIATQKEKLRTVYRMVSDYLKSKDTASRIFIVHRLDRDVSGVMALAKNEKAKRTMQKEWTSAEKLYVAVVEGRPRPEEGTVSTWLCQNKAMRVYVCDQAYYGAAEAVTHYKTIRSAKGRSLVEVRIETGRKHQIRVHMAHVGCPVCGDETYGGAEKMKGGIALHASVLGFDHPATKKRMAFTSPTPARMKGLV